MKNIIRITGILLLLTVVFGSSNACKKDEETVIKEVFDTTGYVRVATRVFESDDRTTTGSLLIYGNSTNLVYVFKNFKTESGSGLEVRLSNDLSDVAGAGSLKLGDLKGVEGEFYYTASNSTASYSYLVIWSSGLGVKYGHAFTI